MHNGYVYICTYIHIDMYICVYIYIIYTTIIAEFAYYEQVIRIYGKIIKLYLLKYYIRKLIFPSFIMNSTSLFGKVSFCGFD